MVTPSHETSKPMLRAVATTSQNWWLATSTAPHSPMPLRYLSNSVS